MKYTMLYADDEIVLAEINTKIFEENGYNVICVTESDSIMEKYKQFHPNIVVLDVNMPGMNGFQIAQNIKELDINVPIIFLTSLSDSDNAIKGFKAGANDYIRKEADIKEILERIKTAIRISPVKKDNILKITNITQLDTFSQQLISCGKTYNLNAKEYNLLLYWVLHPNTIYDRDDLEYIIWGSNSLRKTYLKQYVSNIRKMLSDDKNIEIVVKRSESICFVIKQNADIDNS